jgi:hypothetical protein
LKEHWKTLARIVRHKKAPRKGTLYKFQDPDRGVVTIVDITGQVIDEKPIDTGEQLYLGSGH